MVDRKKFSTEERDSDRWCTVHELENEYPE